MHYVRSRKVTGLKPDEVYFSIYLILPAALWPWGLLSLQQNEYQEFCWGLNGGGHVRLTILPPSVSQLSTENVGASTSHNPMACTACYRDSFYLDEWVDRQSFQHIKMDRQTEI
jgi:hypothetical protein